MNDDVTLMNWRKPSRSFSNGNCAEVASGNGFAAVRDSKDSAGPVLLFGADAWRCFAAALKDGTLEP